MIYEDSYFSRRPKKFELFVVFLVFLAFVFIFAFVAVARQVNSERDAAYLRAGLFGLAVAKRR